MKNFLIIAALSLCPLLAKALPSVIGSASTNGSTYYLLSNSSWTDAEAEAVALGGHLATVASTAQQNWIWNTFSTYSGVNRDLWIGLTDPSHDSGGGHINNFSWVSGNPSTFRNWQPGEPNNGGGVGGEYWTEMDFFYGGTWNDGANTPSFPGKIELNFGLVQVVPEPSSGLLFAVGIAGVWMRNRFSTKDTISMLK